MSNQKTSLEANQKFNVYAGCGVYLSAMSGCSRQSEIDGHIYGKSAARYGEIKPLELNRADAIRACHVARAQGVQSWLVAAQSFAA